MGFWFDIAGNKLVDKLGSRSPAKRRSQTGAHGGLTDIFTSGAQHCGLRLTGRNILINDDFQICPMDFTTQRRNRKHHSGRNHCRQNEYCFYSHGDLLDPVKFVQPMVIAGCIPPLTTDSNKHPELTTPVAFLVETSAAFYIAS